MNAGDDFIKAFDGNNINKPRFESILTDEVDENTKIKLNYKKEYGTSEYSADIFNNWRISASFDRQLTKRIKIDLSTFYGEGEYLSNKTSDKLSGANIGLEYALSDPASIYINYVYQEQQSNSDSSAYTKNLTQLGFKYLF